MFIDVDGARTFVHTGGAPLEPQDGVVVLLHGAGNDHSVWRYQTRRLALLGTAVIAPDLPGHGRSDGEVRTTIEDWASWVADLLDAVGAPQAVLIGHSMGSLISLHAAAVADGTARIRGIGLLATSNRMGVHPELLQAADDRAQLAIDLILGWSHTGVSRFGGHRQAGVWNTGGHRRLLEANIASLGADLRTVATYDSRPAAAAVAARIAAGDLEALVVAGDVDRMTPASSGRAMADAIGVPLDVLPGVGHVFPYDTPVELNELLLPWVAETVAHHTQG